jgi:hypothetical protein
MKAAVFKMLPPALALSVILLVHHELYSRAYDFWMYGKSLITDGNPNAPAYTLHVWGVGGKPTFVRVVRFPDHAAAPKNYNEVAMHVSPQLNSYTRNVDRWKSGCVLLAGRSLDEQIAIELDGDTAKRLFDRPGDQYDDYDVMESLWNREVVPHMPADD